MNFVDKDGTTKVYIPVHPWISHFPCAVHFSSKLLSNVIRMSGSCMLLYLFHSHLNINRITCSVVNSLERFINFSELKILESERVNNMIEELQIKHFTELSRKYTSIN